MRAARSSPFLRWQQVTTRTLQDRASTGPVEELVLGIPQQQAF
jgi:hypothetical protein